MAVHCQEIYCVPSAGLLLCALSWQSHVHWDSKQCQPVWKCQHISNLKRFLIAGFISVGICTSKEFFIIILEQSVPVGLASDGCHCHFTWISYFSSQMYSHICLSLFLLYLTRWMKFGPVRETFHPHFLYMLVPRRSQWPKHEKVADDSEPTSIGLSIDGVRKKKKTTKKPGCINCLDTAFLYLLTRWNLSFFASGGSTVSTLSCCFHLLAFTKLQRVQFHIFHTCSLLWAGSFFFSISGNRDHFFPRTRLWKISC